jgi:hypothetical protein
VPGWILNEISNFGGPMDCWITAKAIKFKLPKLGLTTIITAPKWDALVYNESTKNMMSSPHDTWTKKFLMHRTAKEGSKKDVYEKDVTKESKIIAGVKTHKVIVKKNRGSLDKIMPVLEVWVAPEIKAPPQFYAMMNALGVKVDDAGGAPLKLTTLNYGPNDTVSGRISGLECLKAKKTQIPLSEFAPLSGYKKVTDEMALMMDEGDQDMMTGGAEPSTAKPKPSTKTADDMSNLFGAVGKSKK